MSLARLSLLVTVTACAPGAEPSWSFPVCSCCSLSSVTDRMRQVSAGSETSKSCLCFWVPQVRTSCWLLVGSNQGVSQLFPVYQMEFALKTFWAKHQWWKVEWLQHDALELFTLLFILVVHELCTMIRVLQFVYTFMSRKILDACQIWEIMSYVDILVKSQQWDHRSVESLLLYRNISVCNDSSLPTYVKVLADSLFISTLYCCVFILADVLCLPCYCI